MSDETCAVEVYEGGGELTVYDPAGVLTGARWIRCNKPAVARGIADEPLCMEHADYYPGPKTLIRRDH